MQLSLPGTHGSSTTHPGWAAPGGTASASLRRVATSASPDRRRSMAISRPSWRPGERASARPCSPVRPPGPGSASTGSASPGSASPGSAGTGSASTGRHATGSVKLARYWIQSQTTRSRARSTSVALSAPKTGPRAAGMSTAPGPRSFATGRMSMCMAAPGPGADGTGEPGARENLRDAPGKARRHDVDAADPRYLEDLLDDFRAHRQPLIGYLVGRDAAQPPADLVRDPQARDVALHVLQRPQRSDRPDTGEDLAAPVQPEVADIGHPARERGHVEDELGLRELRAGGHLLAEPGRAEAGRRGERVLDRTDVPVRRRVQRAPGQQPPLVAHGAGGPHELDAVQVEHGLGVRVVAEPRVVAGHQDHVEDAEGGGGQQVGLERDPVAVAAGDLHDRLDARGQGEEAARPVGQPG